MSLARSLRGARPICIARVSAYLLKTEQTTRP